MSELEVELHDDGRITEDGQRELSIAPRINVPAENALQPEWRKDYLPKIEEASKEGGKFQIDTKNGSFSDALFLSGTNEETARFETAEGTQEIPLSDIVAVVNEQGHDILGKEKEE